MALTTTMLSTSQTAWMTVAEASALLTGARKTAWDAAETADKESALQDAFLDVQDLHPMGDIFLDAYEGFPPQRMNLPTTLTAEYDNASASTGTTTGSIITTGLSTTQSHSDTVGGVIVNDDTSSAGYREVAAIESYDADTDTFTVGSGFSVAPDGNIIIVWPMYWGVRMALAIQAHYRLLKIKHRSLAQAQASGFAQTEGGDSVEIGRTAKYHKTWDEQAISMIRPYLTSERYVAAGRA